MFKVTNKNTRRTSLTLFWCFYCWLWTYFTSFSSVFIVNFEPVNISWAPIQAASILFRIICKQIMLFWWCIKSNLERNSKYFVQGSWTTRASLFCDVAYIAHLKLLFLSGGEANPAGINLFKVNNRNTRTRCEICL